MSGKLKQLYSLAGTRQTFKTGVKTLGGPDKFPFTVFAESRVIVDAVVSV